MSYVVYEDGSISFNVGGKSLSSQYSTSATATFSAKTVGTTLTWSISMSTSNGPYVYLYLSINGTEIYKNYFNDEDDSEGSKVFPRGNGTSASGSLTIKNTDTSIPIVLKIGPSSQTDSLIYTNSTDSNNPTGSTKYLTRNAVTYYTISYNANGGSGAPSSQDKKYGTALTLSSTKPTKNSITTTRTVTINANGGSSTVTSRSSTATITYSFSHWNTTSNGTGTIYYAGGSYTSNADATLYAQYSSSTSSYSAVTLPTTSQCTRSGYQLLGFATSSSATSAAYLPGASYTPSSNVTLYAVWQLLEFTVTFDANGGSVIPTSKTVKNGETYGELPTPIRDYYTFVGWKTNGAIVTSSTTVIATSAHTLYAQWEANALIVNYYSNYASYVYILDTKEGVNLDSTQNIFIIAKSYEWNVTSNYGYKDNDGNSTGDGLPMRRPGYLVHNRWNTKPDGTGISIDAGDGPKTGLEMAQEIGLDLINSSQTINIYPEWEEHTNVYIYDDGAIYASDFIYDNTIYIDNIGRLHAPSFAQSSQFYIEENLIAATGFYYGIPEYFMLGSFTPDIILTASTLTDNTNTILIDNNDTVLVSS